MLRLTRLPLAFAVALVPAAFLLFNANGQSRAAATAIGSLNRIDPEAPPRGSSLVCLAAARGEYEAFQLVLGTEIPLTNVVISVSDLVAADGSTIHSSAFQLYREHFLYVHRSSQDMGGENRPLGPGWYADPLVPLSIPTPPFDVASGGTQAFWADLYVPRSAAHGEYTGDITVSSSERRDIIAVHLTVWNFQLPVKPSLKSSFQIYRPLTDDSHAQAELIRHKLMPFVINSANESVNTTGLRLWTGVNGTTCSIGPPPEIETLREALALADRVSPGVPTYLFSADEVTRCRHIYDELKAWSRRIHASGVSNLVTAIPVPELRDDGSGTGQSVADIWVLLPKQFVSHPDAVVSAMNKGDQIWSYNAIVQDSYSPKWLLDFAPINLRIQPGFISQSLGLTGILYWSVNNWGPDPWRDVQYSVDDHEFPGEGVLIYPGEPVGVQGVVPSIRLKRLRDGIEDYEYVEILKKLGRSDWALELVRWVGADWKTWTRDPAVLEAARWRMGAEIDRLSPH